MNRIRRIDNGHRRNGVTAGIISLAELMTVWESRITENKYFRLAGFTVVFALTAMLVVGIR